MDNICIQEFLILIFIGAVVQPYELNYTPSLKFTVMQEIEKSGHAKTREAEVLWFQYLFVN